jgi:hypothetical protein
MVIKNDECISYQLYHRLDVIKDQDKVYNLILKELNNVAAKHSR